MATTRTNILNSLKTQLTAITARPKVSLEMFMPDKASKNCPYIGIEPGIDENLLDRPDGVRYGFRVNLRLVTKVGKVEDLISQITTLINSPISLDTYCLSCVHVGTEAVDLLDDVNYEYTKIGLAINYYEPKAGYVLNAASFSNGIAGSAQYLVYAYLSSGSLVTNMYDSAYKAGLKTTAMSVDVVSCTPIRNDFGTRGTDQVINYSVILAVKVHTTYDNQGMNTPLNISTMDSVVNRLNNHRQLNSITGYRIMDVSGQRYQVNFEESLTTGAEVIVDVHHTQWHSQV